VENAPPEHAGLGVGTQLGLAVARGVAHALARDDLDAVALAAHIGRGQRSAIGVHGFDRGGFLVDGGKGPRTDIAPLLARVDFPEDWNVLLAVPRGRQGLHGAAEREAFLQAAQAPASRQTDALCRLLLLGVLPALIEHDLPAFSLTLTEFNRKVGEMFKPWQGGAYADAQTAALVDRLARDNVAAGQSSWGPAVFGIGAAERLTSLRRRLTAEFADREILITSASNVAASLSGS
jgi:beta-RFAP synthase